MVELRQSAHPQLADCVEELAMEASVRRAVGSLLAAGLLVLGLPAIDSPALAASTVSAASDAFGITSYSVQEIRGSGDITAELARAVSTGESADQVKIVHIPSGRFTVNSAIRFQTARIYLVAEPTTMVTLTRSDARLLYLSNSAVGVYGGSWNAARLNTSAAIQANATDATLMSLRVVNSAGDGVTGYNKAVLRLQDVSVSGSARDGVHVENSTLIADKLTSTRNYRNGVQLSTSSRGTITNSVLDSNGLAVRGTTTGKTGHGLGATASVVGVKNTSISSNRVCGVSLVTGSALTITGGTVNRNGRHGLGTMAGVKATLIGTTVYRNGYNGVLAAGSRTRVSLNRVGITSSHERGLSVKDHGRVGMVGTLIRSSGLNNISIGTRGRVSMGAGNVLRDAARGNGVAVVGKSLLTIQGKGNVIRGSRQNGLFVSGASSAVRIYTATVFRSNRGYGILATSRAKVKMVKSSFSRNGHSMRATSGARIRVVH